MAKNQQIELNISLPRSIADQVYERIKGQILDGSLDPGQHLHELVVAKAAGTSRTPVREAFRRLEQDLLVERVPKGGVRVIKLDLNTIKDLYELRTVLEVHAVDLACQRITSEQIVYLKRIRAQALELLNSSHISQDYLLKHFMELNTDFHEMIYHATKSKFLIRIINRLRGIIRAVRSVSLQANQAPVRSWEEHSRLICCLEKRDTVAAQKLIYEHIRNATREALSVVDNARQPHNSI